MPAMDTTQLAGYAAGGMTLAAHVPYVASILRGETRPNRASWLIWCTVSAILAASYRQVADNDAFWMPVAYSTGAAVVLGLS